LSALPKSTFANDYAYNKFAAGPFGLRAPMGAAATVTLPRPRPAAANMTHARFLRLIDVDARSFSVALEGNLPTGGSSGTSTK
jgi:thiosulfate dehydrogenase (quinone)